MKKVCKAVFSPDCYKFILLAVSILNVCPLINVHIDKYLKLLHVYAALVIAFDLYGERCILKNKGRILLVAFVLSYCVTMLCNPEILNVSGLSFFVYLVEALLLIYSYGDRNEKRDSICVHTLVLLATISSIVGIWMFYVKFYQMPVYQRFIGMYPVENRLAGLFGNPNSLGLICLGTCCLCFIRLVSECRGAGKTFYGAAFFINLIAMLLSNCRTAIYASVCLVAIYVFFRLLRDVRSVKRVFLALIAAAATAAVGYFACMLLQKGLSLLDVNYDYYCEFIMNKDSVPEGGGGGTGETIQRFLNNGIFNGRGYLWSNGWKAFTQQPLFGCGLDNYEQTLLDMGVSAYWAAYSLHNSYLEALVTFGLAGFACAVVFLAMVAKNVVMFFRFADREQWNRAGGLLACAGAFLIAAMMESMLAVPLSPGCVFFWIIMSWLMQLLESENQKSGHFRPEPLGVWTDRMFARMGK